MISSQECRDLIKTQFQKDFNQKENLSQLMTNSRWENRTECFWYFGNMWNLQNYLTNIQNNNYNADSNITNSKDDSLQQNAVHTSANVSSNQDDGWWFSNFWIFSIYIILSIFVILIFNKLLRYTLRWGYVFLNYNRMVYMKILVPRWDSKVDREQSKELAKDMKEKIGRMSQVYLNLHKLGRLSFRDKIMYKIFRKPRIVMMYHYEDWVLNFIVACFPEYQKIVEWAIGAQFSESSIEVIKRPNIFKKKYSKVMPLQSQKDSIYTLKLYKKMTDDPINNIIDSMNNISRYDTATVVMTIKPLPDSWNETAKKKVDRLYKNLDIKPTWFFPIIFYGLKTFFTLIFTGKMPETKREQDVSMVRMVKAQEETINDMAEEIGGVAFESWLILVSSSDEESKLRDNMNSLVSAYTVYTDQYGNELQQLENKATLLGFISRPLWSIAAKYHLTNLFYNSNTFTTSELTWLFHFPDYTYNRSNVIEWMQYKVLPAPSNLPTLSQEDDSWFVMSGVVAENYQWWKLSEILKEYKSHWAVWSKKIVEEKLESIDKFKPEELEWKEIIEKDGKSFVKSEIEKEVYGYKIFKSGVLLWTNIYRNRYSPVYMKKNDRTRHHYCIWKSGTGKSVFLQTLARQDIRNGDGICVIDPHGDLVEDILHYIPKERAKDVVFFDAWDEDRPMWLNLYEIDNIDEADRTVNDATEIFLKMFGPEIFGPRIQEYFKYGSLTIMEDFDDRPTILDVVRLYTDESYREFKVAKVRNPVVRNFWEKTYNAMGDREKAEIIPYFSSKFVSFNTNRLIRNIIWQTKSAFKINEIMDSWKILLINLSKGKIWDLNAQLLGMILVSKIYNAAMARGKIPEKDRRDFYLYVDEFQNFVSGTFADILSEARKYRLCLIMAHQYIAQLEAWQWLNKSEWWKWDVKAAVFGNVGTMMSFKVGAPDAEFLEKEYQPVLWMWDITGIANYKAYVKLNIDNATTRPFSMNAIYTKDYANDKIVPILKEYSAKKYGRKRKFVDAEIWARLWLNLEELDRKQAEWKEVDIQELKKNQPLANTQIEQTQQIVQENKTSQTIDNTAQNNTPQNSSVPNDSVSNDSTPQ